MAQEKILIVDGDITLSEVLKERLGALGYQVDCRRRGSEGLDILKDKWFDLIILSVSLQGGMDGFQLFKEIKGDEEFSKIPIVVQSSKTAMKEAFERMGAELFFVKPYTVSLFLDEIKDILTRKILILGDAGRIIEAIIKNLSRYGFQLDVLDSAGKFYVNIASHRYSLAILQHKVKAKTADRLVSSLRESAKNKDTPAIIYITQKKSDMDEKGIREIRLLKDSCQKLGNCEFMDRTYSSKQLLRLSKKYLEAL